MKGEATQAPAYILQAIHAYGFTPTHVLEVQKGYRNQSYGFSIANGQMLNFILYKHEPNIVRRMKRTNAVADFAFKHGQPARHTKSSKIIKLQDSHIIRYGALYGYLPGHTISWEAYTKTHITLLGQAMGNLHSVLAGYNGALPSIAQEYAHTLGQMLAYFSHPNTVRAIHDKLSLHVPTLHIRELQKFMRLCDKLPGQQALHMDFVRSNILFSDDAELRISGILDFEKTGRGIPMLDIARTLAFLLVDCKYKTEPQIRKYFLDSGYNRRSSNSVRQTFVCVKGARHDLLETLINIFLLHDFYKFLRHNPYEHLYQNEHYVRTANLLLARDILRQL